MNRDCDVVVAGGGPAGALAAFLLARAGRHVRLIDKARFPRPKVCGDCFHPRIGQLLDRIGLGARFLALPHRLADTLCLEAEGRPFHRQPLPGLRVLDRALFDRWLLDEARAAGAEIEEGLHLHAVRADGTVETARGAHRGAYVIGADGRTSLIARQAHLLHRTTCGRVGWQARLSGLAPASAIRMNIFREGYYGLVALAEGGCGNLALVLDARCGTRPEEIVARYLPEARIEALRSIAPISRSPALPARGAIWLVGDAARVVEPFTGEGIRFALASAHAAAEVLRQYWDRPVAETAARYRAAHRALYRGELLMNRITRHLLQTPRARRLVPLLERTPALLRWMTGRVVN